MDKDLVHTNVSFIFSVLRFKIKDSAVSTTKQQYQIKTRRRYVSGRAGNG